MIRIGLAGVGHLGKYHLQLLQEIEGAEFAGCFDIDPAVREEQRKKGVKVFSSYDAMLEDVDAIDIAVPTRDHHKLGKLALVSGKHLFIEKPITRTTEEAEELISLASQNSLTFQIGHIERFNPALRSLQNLELNPRFIESHRLSQFQARGTDVAVILDLMIHDIDIILSLVESPVKQIEASGVPVITESADIANARLTFENGCVANITASRISQKSMRKLRIFQPAAYISIDFQSGTTDIYRLKEEPGEPEGAIPVVLGELNYQNTTRYIVYEQPPKQEANALKEELQSFVYAIQKREEPVVTGKDGLRALEVAQKIQQKLQENFTA